MLISIKSNRWLNQDNKVNAKKKWKKRKEMESFMKSNTFEMCNENEGLTIDRFVTD